MWYPLFVTLGTKDALSHRSAQSEGFSSKHYSLCWPPSPQGPLQRHLVGDMWLKKEKAVFHSRVVLAYWSSVTTTGSRWEHTNEIQAESNADLSAAFSTPANKKCHGSGQSCAPLRAGNLAQQETNSCKCICCSLPVSGSAPSNFYPQVIFVNPKNLLWLKNKWQLQEELWCADQYEQFLQHFSIYRKALVSDALTHPHCTYRKGWGCEFEDRLKSSLQ